MYRERKPFTRVALIALASLSLVVMGAILSPAVAATHPISAAPMVRIPGNVLPALKHATLIEKPGATEAEANLPIALTIVLKRDRQRAFERFLRKVYDPASPQYHHFLTQPQLAGRFGPSPQRYGAVLSYFEHRGFKLLDGSANRLTLTLRATRKQAEQALSLRIRDYAIGGHTFFANDRAPALPTQLARSIGGIVGLSDLATPNRPKPKMVRTDALYGLGLDGLGSDAKCFGQGSTTVGSNLDCMFTLCGLPLATGQPNLGANLAAAISSVLKSSVLQFLKITAINKVVCGGAMYATGVAGITCEAMGLGDPTVWGRIPQCIEFCNAGFGPARICGATASVAQGTSQVQSGENSPSDRPSALLSNAPDVSSQIVQKIGLLEYDTFNVSDVQNWLALLGGQSAISKLSVVDVNGGVATPGPFEDEVLVDIDTVMLFGSLPGITYTVYDAPPSTSFETMFNAMINDGDTVISNSYSQCEDQTSAAEAKSIDSVLAQAAASGIAVFNGSGDSGSTCLDGSPNTIGVPSDSPNATAVGGTTPSPLQTGLTYGSEKWWNGSAETPPSGQGGFGVSKFFAAPSYQSSLSGSSMRSVPDVVADADPSEGIEICQADAGGCPTGGLYGGTSFAAPEWAAYWADLSVMVGTNLGNANAKLYPLSGTDAFHDAGSMGSDFAHVGLGSPDLVDLAAHLSGATVGSVSASLSIVAAAGPNLDGSVYADGKNFGAVQVTLLDADGLPLSGKSVSLGAVAGSATITPASVVTGSDGSAVFTVSDSTAEDVTFIATDETDGGTKLANQPTLAFTVPPAVSAEITAANSNAQANGTADDAITVTLTDSLGRPTPGKVVTLSQGSGQSAISAPNPSVTDSNGQIQFAISDLQNEQITYTATDVTDGNLPVPGSASVTFGSGPGGCGSASYVVGSANPASGYDVNTFASGFTVSGGNQGFSYNCVGAYGMAWDASGNLYVTDWPTGEIYKFPPTGGVADSSTLFTTVKAPATGLAIDPAGNMFVSEGSVSGAFGDIVPVDITTKALGTPFASNTIECLAGLALDPSIPALYADDFCSAGTGGSPYIWQITGIDNSSPNAPVVYAQVPSTENFELSVAPDGTLYDSFGVSGGADIARISTASPPVVQTLTGADGTPISTYGSLGLAAGGQQANGDAQFLIGPFGSPFGTSSSSTVAAGVETLDLTASPPVQGVQLTTSYFSGLENEAIGPDGCLYVAGGPTVSKITNADGSCSFGPTTQPPTISLTPTTVSPNPAQGSSQSFTASLHYSNAPAGTPLFLTVAGANGSGNAPQVKMAATDANGQASFSYLGIHAGVDNVSVSADLNNSPVNSNPVRVTWEPGPDATFLTLNQSAGAGTQGQTVTVTANLTDVSANPIAPLVGQPVEFTLGGDSCSVSTDSNGNAACQVMTGATSGMETLHANYAGTSDYLASSASKAFNVIAPVATPTPTPVPGKLSIHPHRLNFGAVDVGSNRMRTVTIVNKGKITKKRSADPITIEMESVTPDAFAVTQNCNQVLNPKIRYPKAQRAKPGQCEVQVTFTPAAAQEYTGTLTIEDNLEPDEMQEVPLKGKGKQPKSK